MKFREQVPVKIQIAILPVISLLGFVGVLLLLYSGMAYQAEVSQNNLARLALTENLQKFQNGMTTLRVSEKNFFVSKNVEDMAAHKKAVDALFTILSDIQNNHDLIITPEQIHEWQAMLNDYQHQYIDAATELSIIGASENMGLRGTMRHAVHIIENRIRDENLVLMRDMLEVRRHEKDFIIRLNDKYFNQWEKSVQVLRKSFNDTKLTVADKTAIDFLLPIYIDSFRTLVEHKRDLIIDGETVDTLSKDILESFNLVRLEAMAHAKTAGQAEFDAERAQFQKITLFALSIGVFTFMVSHWIGNGIRISLQLITQSMTRLTSGDLETNISAIHYSNEIGAMAHAIQGYRENEIWRIVAVRHLDEAKRQTENIIKTMNEALFELDKDGVINMTNPAAGHLLGIPDKDLIGKKLSDFFAKSEDNQQRKLSETARLELFEADLKAQCFENVEEIAPLFDMLAAPLLLVDNKGQLVWGNAKAEKALGCAQVVIAGLHIRSLLPQWLKNDHKKNFEVALDRLSGRMIADGKAMAVRHMNGSEIEMSIGVVSFLIGQEKYFLFICKRDGLDAELGTVTDPEFSCPFGSLELNLDIVRFVLPMETTKTAKDSMVTYSGKTIKVSYSGALLRDDLNCITGAIVTVHDITERTLDEQKILQFKRTLDQSSDQVYLFWPETFEIFYQNRSARDLTGWEIGSGSVKTLMDLNPDFTPEIFQNHLKKLFDSKNKRIIYERTEYRTKRPVEVTIEYVAPEAGTAAYFVKAVRDISERKAAEQAKAEFVSTISHELRTPLTSIKGALGVLDAGVVGAMNEKSRSLVAIALNNSNRLAVLINEILDFEKTEAGKMDYNIEAMDISELVHQAIEANGSYAESYGIRLVSKGAEKLVMVEGDKNRLMQVLTNLISNAAKFSNKGEKVEVSLMPMDDKVRVAVKDTGHGIPMAAQKTIFEKFTQVDSSIQRKKGGTGLGLNIVRKMVKAHGSSIAFESTEGQGSTFYFDLDIIAAAPK